MPYCIYLRKSRKDAEAELRGEGETLARHEQMLLRLAKKLKLNITQIYREIVSGESIASRPVMQQLLSEVEQGVWDGVLVAEVERLARGDSIDQGIVSQAFKFSGTKIITPIKTYDPDNEFDEEYFEFGLFMSRREYKTINRRLQRGREASAREGKYIASIAPYGYKRVKIENDKGYTLEIVPNEAEIVRMIFSMYTSDRMGIQAIARKLNEMGVPPHRHDYWQKSTLRDILINPVYAGKIRWGWRKNVKKQVNGQVQTSRPRNYNDDCILVQGLHKPIVSEEVFNLAQKYLQEAPTPPVNYKSEIKNPFAGLIRCGKCGRSMVFRRRPTPNKKDYIVCHARACNNVSAPFDLIERRILLSISQWIGEYQVKVQTAETQPTNTAKPAKEKALKALEREKTTLQSQMDKLHDLLEQGVYSVDVFLERSRILADKMADTDSKISSMKNEFTEQENNLKLAAEIIPKAQHLLDTYDDIPDAATKNKMLKEVVKYFIYTKTVNGAYKNHSADDFEIVMFPQVEI